jgi:hypothetical protein
METSLIADSGKMIARMVTDDAPLVRIDLIHFMKLIKIQTIARWPVWPDYDSAHQLWFKQM